jgi:hypothetical protein
MNPANDARTWDKDDDWWVCGCGSQDFWIRRNAKSGFCHVICRKCEQDHTVVVFRGEDDV